MWVPIGCVGATPTTLPKFLTKHIMEEEEIEKPEQFITKLQSEYDDLNDKIYSLSESIHHTYDFNLQYDLKRAQLSTMTTYLHILRMRIEDLTKTRVVEYDRY